MTKETAKAYALPIVAGLFIGTSYIPFPPWAIFFGLVPLFLFWAQTKSPGQAFLAGWLTQFVLNLIGFHWIAYTAIEFGHFPKWGGYLSLLGFASIAHLHYPVAGWIAVKARNTFRLHALWFFAVCSVAFAICEHLTPMIFPWHLGYPWLWAGFPGAQLADVIGFEGLNIATICVNGLIACSIFMGVMHPPGLSAPSLATNGFSNKKKSLGLIGIAIALVAIINLLGLGRGEKWKQADASIKVLTVQGNIGNFDKEMAELGRNFRFPIVSKFLDLTDKGLKEHPDSQVVLWPETAFPDVLDIPYQNDPSAARLRKFVVEHKMPLLTGSYSYDPSIKATYNGFFFMNAFGQTPEPPYRKSILLVFGETFPFSDYIPYMAKLFPDLGSFGRGQGPTVMTVGAGGQLFKLGPQICYEGLYPWFTVELAKKGAQVLSNVTNDSWFGIDFEPYQHLYMTLARAIEVRRPLIRSTNTGITTAITAAGEILQTSPQAREWTGAFEIPYLKNPPHTFYETMDGLWIWILFGSFILLLIFARNKNVQKEM
jgi:apolipoprotein N-acyltransferase